MPSGHRNGKQTPLPRTIRSAQNRAVIPISHERIFNVTDVGAMVRVHEFADGGFRDAEPATQRHLGHALCAHDGIMRQLGGHDGGQGQQVLSFGERAWRGNVATGMNVSGQGGAQGFQLYFSKSTGAGSGPENVVSMRLTASTSTSSCFFSSGKRETNSVRSTSVGTVATSRYGWRLRDRRDSPFELMSWGLPYSLSKSKSAIALRKSLRMRCPSRMRAM